MVVEGEGGDARHDRGWRVSQTRPLRVEDFSVDGVGSNADIASQKLAARGPIHLLDKLLRKITTLTWMGNT